MTWGSQDLYETQIHRCIMSQLLTDMCIMFCRYTKCLSDVIKRIRDCTTYNLTDIVQSLQQYDQHLHQYYTMLSAQHLVERMELPEMTFISVQTLINLINAKNSGKTSQVNMDDEIVEFVSSFNKESAKNIKSIDTFVQKEVLTELTPQPPLSARLSSDNKRKKVTARRTDRSHSDTSLVVQKMGILTPRSPNLV